jgi:hypothetical protein
MLAIFRSGQRHHDHDDLKGLPGEGEESTGARKAWRCGRFHAAMGSPAGSATPKAVTPPQASPRNSITAP